MAVRNLILEIGTEELPASIVWMGIKQLKENAERVLSFNRLKFKEIDAMGTPRRLVLCVKDLKGKQESFTEEVKGPAKHISYTDQGESTAAAVGFAKSQEVKPSELVVKKIPSGEYVFAIRKEEGNPATQILPKVLPEIVLSLSFPKPMRWEGDLKFPRPIRWLLSFYGEEFIEFTLSHLVSSNLTYGHRLLSKGPIVVKSADDYFRAMKEGKVIVDQRKREALIDEQIEKISSKLNGKAIVNPKVFSENVNLTENPFVVCGEFSSELLLLPKDVIVTAMESHQRYFAVEDLSEKLMAKFIFVHNGDEKFNELIKKGHERVLKARLTDAKFFFEEDLKVPFVKYVEKLKEVVHQEKLGTLFDKTIRLRDFVKVIAEKLSLENEVIKNVERAAYLCKADLVTDMVVEFPELQGIMAREYARLSSESEEIANAIFEHYLPRTSEDVLPSSIEGKVLSLADKIDEIVGCFSIGLIPTGSEDPYALRKQATGIINILLQNQFHLFLDKLIEFLLSKMKVERDLLPNVKAITEEFFLGRLRAQLLGEGYGFDSIDSVLSLKLFDVLEVKNRVKVLDKLRGSEILNDIVTAFTRCKNLANLSAGAKVNCSFLMEEEEKKLFSRLIEAENKVAECLGAYDYKEALGILSGLRPIIDRFFDKVLVMTEEENIRDNRLALLNKSVSLFIKVADFSRLVVLEEK